MDCKYRWTTHLHVLLLARNEAKISRIYQLLSCAEDVIWSQSLFSNNQWVEPQWRCHS